MHPSIALLLALALPSVQNPPQAEFLKAWDSIQSAIRQRYYARETRKGEMESLLAKYSEKAKTANSIEGFGSAVNAMIAEFKDSHFALFTKEDQGYYAMDGLMRREPEEMPHIGAWFRKTERGYQVQMVLNGMAAEKAGIRKGEFVVSIDGKPFSPVASLADIVGRSGKLVVRDRNGKERQVDVAVVKQSAPKMFLEATNNSARVIERAGKKLGYMRLWTQASDDFRNAVSNLVYGRLQDTDGFILDLRDGFGGRPEGFADPFFRPEVNLEWQFGATAPKMKQPFGYQRPLVVIINEGSRSAKEVLSYILKTSKRATLVGSNTAGHVLGTSPMRINDWAYLEIPMVEVFADGLRLEGVGVAPDVRVPQEFDDAGNDLFLRAAENELMRKITTQASKAA